MLLFLKGIQYLGILILIIEIIYILRQEASSQQSLLLVMIISILINFTGYLFEINATSQEMALQAVKFLYFGKPFIMLCMFLFTMQYCGIHLHKVFVGILTMIHMGITILVYTCEHHTLFYSSIGYSYDGLLPHLVLGRGVFYMLYMLLMALYMIVILIVCIRRLHQVRTRLQKIHIWGLLSMELVAITSLVIYLTGLTGGYDSTLVGYLIGSLILLIVMFRYRLFDMLTIAKNDAMNHFKDGLLVLNYQDELLYVNRQAAEIYPDLNKHQMEPVRKIAELFEAGERLQSRGLVYEIRQYPIVKNDMEYGYMYILYDVTDSYNYTERLQKEVSEKTDYIRTIQRKVTLGLANIIESRDDSTGGHVKRTSDVIKIFVEKLAQTEWGHTYPPEFFENIINAAPMHDLGKIAVPDRLLRKPGPFTPEEYIQMKSHAEKGAEIVSRILDGIEDESFIRTAVNIAHYHHEKWNGKGYPCGLSGNDIPAEARIMALADVFDALVSKRCYKDKFSYAEAFSIIEDSLGSHFDRDLGEQFLDCREQLIAYYNAAEKQSLSLIS